MLGIWDLEGRLRLEKEIGLRGSLKSREQTVLSERRGAGEKAQSSLPMEKAMDKA